MTFLTKFMSINLTEIIFKNFQRKIISKTFQNFRHKIGHFLRFFLFWALFSLKNFFRPNFFFNSFYIPKWSKKKLFGNIFFRLIFIPILGKSEKSFYKSFLFKIEICPKTPFLLVGENDVCPKSYQNPFIS